MEKDILDIVKNDIKQIKKQRKKEKSKVDLKAAREEIDAAFERYKSLLEIAADDDTKIEEAYNALVDCEAKKVAFENLKNTDE